MDIVQIKRLQKTSAIFGILGPVINIIVFTILGLVYPGYNPISQFISELASNEAPTNIYMNIFGFVIFGLYLIFFGVGLYLGVEKHFLTKISMILFVISGICILSLPMFPCDSGCGNLTFTGIGHNILIKLPSITMPAAIILSLYPLWRDYNWKKYWWFFFVLIGIYIIIYSPISILIDISLVNGLIQRLGLSVPITWILIMSIRLYRITD
ncbi:MAG: DUF998 domain-containing protein [Promethearchaeota archaeon]|nr:MAG: DUF998 domain-containing protein [Candidatus Lokiarchaeota archaeon]